MPQMSPMNWISLYFYMSSLYFILIILNYYLFLYKPLILSLTKTKKKTTNWKW